MTIIKALVIGCNGQDGSLISKSLLKKGYVVVGITRKKLSFNQTHSDLEIEKDLRIEVADITNFSSMTKFIEKENPSEIYNLAGQSSVGKSFLEPITTLQSISNGTLNILESARKTDFEGRLFFAGSSEIFGETDKRANIDHEQNPVSPYAIAKQTSFNLVKLYRQIYNTKCVTGILFNHESPYRSENFITHKIINGAIHCLHNKNHKINLGNINVYRDWGWAEEYVEAMQIMLKNNKLNDFTICTGEINSLKNFIELTFKKLNLNYNNHIFTDQSLYRPSDIKKSFGDPNPIKKHLKWEAKSKMEQVIEKLIEDKLRRIKSVNL